MSWQSSICYNFSHHWNVYSDPELRGSAKQTLGGQKRAQQLANTTSILNLIETCQYWRYMEDLNSHVG